jgi:hypothetical protein
MAAPINPTSRNVTAYINGVALLSGACVLCLEVLGTRVIGPVFGAGLYAWAALLSVTLVSLSAGYVVGGRIVDRTPTLLTLARVLLAAGLWIALIPLLARAVLGACLTLGPRLGPMCSALVLLGPCLVVLGCVAPISVRLVASEPSTLGRRVGTLYGISTLGSLLGVLATAFWLIPSATTPFAESPIGNWAGHRGIAHGAHSARCYRRRR